MYSTHAHVDIFRILPIMDGVCISQFLLPSIPITLGCNVLTYLLLCVHCYCDILLSGMENGTLNGAPPNNAHPYVVGKEPFCSHKTVVPNPFYLVHLLTPKKYFVHPRTNARI